MHESRDLVALYDQCFREAFNTVLIGGGEEPVYLPASRQGEPHKIIFTRDYFASAMHEISHWMIAGAHRRTLEDYGYWYAPDGRTAEQQTEFEQVEVKPQALEWILSRAADAPFRLSSDNLDGGVGPTDSFAQAVASQARKYCREGVNPRAREFIGVLSRFYRTDSPLRAEFYHGRYL